MRLIGLVLLEPSAEIRKELEEAIMIWEDAAIDELTTVLLDLAVKQRLPTIVDRAKWAISGALICALRE